MPITDETQASFLAVLEGEDELGLVLRAHIHIESLVEKILEKQVSDLKQLNKIGLDYSQKVSLAIALGLRDVYAPPMQNLGTLRNAFAHRLDTRLSKEKVDAFYKSFSSDDRTLIHESYEKTKRKNGHPVPPFKDLSAQKKFIIITIFLRAVLLAALLELSY